MKEMLKKIPLTMIKALAPKKKDLETYVKNCRWMVHGKSAKGLSPLRRSTLSKKHKIRRMRFKKLYEANKWWNE